MWCTNLVLNLQYIPVTLRCINLHIHAISHDYLDTSDRDMSVRFLHYQATHQPFCFPGIIQGHHTSCLSRSELSMWKTWNKKIVSAQQLDQSVPSPRLWLLWLQLIQHSIEDLFIRPFVNHGLQKFALGFATPSARGFHQQLSFRLDLQCNVDRLARSKLQDGRPQLLNLHRAGLTLGYKYQDMYLAKACISNTHKMPRSALQHLLHKEQSKLMEKSCGSNTNPSLYSRTCIDCGLVAES